MFTFFTVRLPKTEALQLNSLNSKTSSNLAVLAFSIGFEIAKCSRSID